MLSATPKTALRPSPSQVGGAVGALLIGVVVGAAGYERLHSSRLVTVEPLDVPPPAAPIKVAMEAPEAAPAPHVQLIADGAQALRQGNPDLAMDRFERAAEQAPTSAEAHIGMARAYMERRQPVAASFELLRALRVNRNHPEAHFLMGEALMDAGRSKQAISFYRRYLELQPEGEHQVRALEAIGAGLNEA